MRETADFDQLFRLYYEQLYYFALQYVANEEDCHDIVSAAYEDVWRNFAHVEAQTVRQYLYTNVRNKCIDTLRRQSRQQRYIEFVKNTSRDYISESRHLEQQDNERIISRILDNLESPTREILEACYLEGKKYREVAEEMNISVATVKKHMVRALKMIREFKNSLKR